MAEHFVEIPITAYSGNPSEFHEIIAEYIQLSEAHGISVKVMIKRLPIYWKGMAREIYYDVMER